MGRRASCFQVSLKKRKRTNESRNKDVLFKVECLLTGQQTHFWRKNICQRSSKGFFGKKLFARGVADAYSGKNYLLESQQTQDTGVIVEEPDAIETILAENDQISIRFAGSELVIQGGETTALLDIYTIAGQQQKCQTINLTDGNVTVAINDLPAGIYVASVKGANGNKTSCKFVIR